MRTYNLNLPLLLGIQLIIRIIVIFLLPQNAVSIDFFSWTKVANLLLEKVNPYVATPYLNWPPLWMQIIYLLSKISILFQINFLRLVQLFLIFSELILTSTLYLGLRSFLQKNPFRLLFWGIVLNPIAIFLNCQHLNFDVLVAIWITLFLIFLAIYSEKKETVYWLYACLFLGLGILTKTVPLILLPLIFVGFKELNIKERILGFILIFAPTLLGLSILYVLNPPSIIYRVLGYRSIPGYFGVTGIIHLLGESVIYYLKLSSFFIILLLIGFSYLIYLKQQFSRHQIFLAGTGIISFLIAFGPGYGPQYGIWIVPFLIFLFPYLSKQEKLFIIISYFIAGSTYFVEYALFSSHGAFLVKIFPTLSNLSNTVSLPEYQTLLRLPLFFVYCSLLLFSTKSLINSLERKQN